MYNNLEQQENIEHYLLEVCSILDVYYSDLEEQDKEDLRDILMYAYDMGYEQAQDDNDIAIEDEYPEDF